MSDPACGVIDVRAMIDRVHALAVRAMQSVSSSGVGGGPARAGLPPLPQAVLDELTPDELRLVAGCSVPLLISMARVFRRLRLSPPPPPEAPQGSSLRKHSAGCSNRCAVVGVAVGRGQARGRAFARTVGAPTVR